ncbi:hypothetical protein C8N34_106289 [Gemmobacter caeni]|jgi:hypothetical protein|uniref:Uncharacterized protein n=1 Tax=Gemmobacter caeni TaxID=589035 RepID=A0A2T6B1Z9_9RHOB|nr:hypothetical protein C8N34_106289 [Gemmobacter caeni]
MLNIFHSEPAGVARNELDLSFAFKGAAHA